MALQVAADRYALHRTSQRVSSCQKTGTITGLQSLYTAPTYKTTSDKTRQPVIPSAELFKDLTDEPKINGELPSTAECAVHLEFLAVLYQLHQTVVESKELDTIFDIKPNKKTVTRKGVATTLKDDTLLPRKQAKWTRFLNLAAARFLTWWSKVPDIYEDEESVKFTDENLPPLDILMVWHSFLLNPRWYRKSCGDGLKLLYKLDFPWALIYQGIIQDDLTFTLSPQSSSTFRTKTQLAPDLLQSLLQWKIYDADLRKRLVEFTKDSDPFESLNGMKNTDRALVNSITTAGATSQKELVDAVVRQSGFVDKMWDKVWIRSPAAEGTIRRARDRYNNFLSLFKLYPTTMFVPTLDIDLVWHTHQCSARSYFKTTQEVAGKFVNHDDSIVQDKLDTGFHDTKALYRMRFGREYSVCGCWDCEALLSAVEKAGKEPDWEDIAKQVSDDVAFYRAVEVARRTKKPVPFR